MITETLLAHAREIIQRTKAMNLRGEIVLKDQLLVFVLADELVMARGLFEVELCVLVVTYRAFGGDASTMLKAMQAECAALEGHVLTERGSATAVSDQKDAGARDAS